MKTTKKKVLIVIGTRPNIVKVTQFKKFGKRASNIDFKIVHTMQHHDKKMAASFFTQLKTKPDFYLSPASRSPNTQIAQVMIGLERVCTAYKPDLVVAVGDVNSTLAAAICANKLSLKLAHLEAGLRSFDPSMPEEHNRVLTDQLADLFFVSEQSGVENLIKEGKPKNAIHLVGNTMIDTLVAFDREIRSDRVLEKLKLKEDTYGLVTMHRPSNVDFRTGLLKMFEMLSAFAEFYPMVFPLHPRTSKRIVECKVRLPDSPRIIFTDPKEYFAFQRLLLGSAFVITDSGGVQEETTFRGIPCLTARPNTERPSTIREGTNQLVSLDDLSQLTNMIATKQFKTSERIPTLWDGRATERVVDVLRNSL